MQVILSMGRNISNTGKTAVKKAEDILRSRNSGFRTGEAIKAGVHPRTIYALFDQGIIERLGRGMYRFADMPVMGNPDLATVALKVPRGVVCLISALSWHEMTSEIPHEIYLALPRGAEPPRLAYPPLRIFWFQGNVFEEGVEDHNIDGIRVRIYSQEKTLADCFKYRNKIGLDVALEAMKLYRQRKRLKIDAIIHFAKICRVEKVMHPYLEAIL
jgi:predicted transcriptional regulator of viral defense system